MSLFPTRTRLALLEGVRQGHVQYGIGPDGVPGAPRRQPAAWDISDPRRGPRKVSAAIEEMERAGWVERPDRTAVWQLTDAGRKVLDEQVATRYRVEFARVGRNHNVAAFGPVVSGPDHAERIAEEVHGYAGRHLSSRCFVVSVDLAAGKGCIEGGRFGTFTVTRVGAE
ncbi:hypothetical protein E1193_11765 [Micromonospora sp. KC606]|uniref:hypothetical protein n=1 Tax=Micromonospora sp. KC606 TaxID=2530379 RepID=UPI00104AE3CF|nr:hypothetical protein [Micromonospora sp. KC606]TDC82420.1 hypothetical protein E1193_11765 [Micromonospora sp. KC606]